MPYETNIDLFAEFQRELIGTWENQHLGKDQNNKPVGGKKHPLSYNVMPLPQESEAEGYILKNFTYFEKIKFNNDDPDHTIAIAASAPNRGGGDFAERACDFLRTAGQICRRTGHQ